MAARADRIARAVGLCVTHDQTEAMAMSDRILLLRNGRIEQEGTPAELRAALAGSAEFMGSNNRIDARVAAIDGERVTLAGDGWELQALARDTFAPVGRPGRDPPRACAGRRRPGANRLQADLVTSMYLGDRWEYLFHCGEMRLRAFGHAARGRQALDRIPDQRLLGVRESRLTPSRRPTRRRACIRAHPFALRIGATRTRFLFQPAHKTKETPSK